MNGTLCGNVVFPDIIKMRLNCISVGTKFNYCCPYKRTDIQRDKNRESHGMMEAEIEVIKLQAKGCQGMPATSRSYEKVMEQTFFQSLQKKPTLPTPRFWTSNIQNYVRIHFCSFKPPSL